MSEVDDEKAAVSAAEILLELANDSPGGSAMVPVEWGAAPADLLRGALRLARDLQEEFAERVQQSAAERAELKRSQEAMTGRLIFLEEQNRHLADCNQMLKLSIQRDPHPPGYDYREAFNSAAAERDELLDELLRLRRKLRELAGGDEQRAIGGGAVVAQEKAAPPTLPDS